MRTEKDNETEGEIRRRSLNLHSEECIDVPVLAWWTSRSRSPMSCPVSISRMHLQAHPASRWCARARVFACVYFGRARFPVLARSCDQVTYKLASIFRCQSGLPNEFPLHKGVYCKAAPIGSAPLPKPSIPMQFPARLAARFRSKCEAKAQPPAIACPLGSYTRNPQPPACLASGHQRTHAPASSDSLASWLLHTQAPAGPAVFQELPCGCNSSRARPDPNTGRLDIGPRAFVTQTDARRGEGREAGRMGGWQRQDLST